MADDNPKTLSRRYFSKVVQAREALRAQAEQYIALHKRAILIALQKGEVEAAGKMIQWALEHVEDEDGGRVVGASVDKPKPQERISGPQINFGFTLGGVKAPVGELPPAVIDVEAIEEAKADDGPDPEDV